MTHALPALKRLPLLSELALVVLLAWMLAGWLLPTDETLISNTTIKNIATAPNALPKLNTLTATQLFGQQAQQAQVVAPVRQAPKAIVMRPLGLKLLGTVVAGKHSAAIIAISAGGKQSAFFIGDRIQAGVTLKIVETNSIVVDRNGSLERISLEQGKKIISKPMQPTTMSTVRPAASPSRSPIASTSFNQQMNRKHLQQQLQDIPSLLSQALAKPSFSNGKMNGFSITNIVPGSLYAQAGLQNGDIIMAINGEKITNAAQAMTIYTKLKSAASLDLQLMRASNIQNIHFDIR